MKSKILKYNKENLIIFAISIVVLISSIFIYQYLKYNSKGLLDEAKNYKSVIQNDEEKAGDAVYVEIAEIPYLVATETIDSSKLEYYVVYDKENHAYIVNLKRKTYNKICDEYNKDKNNFTYVISGRLKKIPYELERIIINEFNEEQDEINLTLLNYKNYFGTTYLDENVLAKSTVFLAITELFGLVSGMMAVIYFIIIIKGFINIKKTLSNVSKVELENEFNQSNLIEYSKAKIILLDNYFVSMDNGMIANEYTDISWIYISENTKTKIGTYSMYYKIMDKLCIMIYLKNGKKYKTSAINNKDSQIYNQIIEELVKRNPNIMVGYSFENLNNYNKIKNNNK